MNTNVKAKSLEEKGITLRSPASEDGYAVFKLIEQCPPLDTNSSYCNLLQCTHFSDTSVAAFKEGELVGFISGYLIPGKENTLFIWQVAVGEKARGCGLATAMLKHILSRHSQVNYLETTITESNEASWALFKGLAAKLTTQLNSEVFFDKERHFEGHHDSELLVQIGPFDVDK